MKKPTMKTIADKLGISTMTVSKSFKNSPDISEDMRRKVLKAARDVGYNYRKKKRHKVLVLTKQTYLSKDDTFYNELYNRLNERSDEKDIQLSLILIKDTEDVLFESYDFSQYDGILLMGQFSHDTTEKMAELEVPSVCIDFYYHGIDIDTVISNNFISAFDATSYLIELGHKKITFLGTLKKTSSINDRYLGYYKAMMESDYESHIATIDDRNSGEIYQTYDLSGALPTAFLCNNDNVAYRLINQLKSLGYNVPGDISVMGFDDVLYSRISEPQITTVRVSRTQMADKSFDLLLEKIEKRVNYTRRAALDCFIKQKDSTKSINE